MASTFELEIVTPHRKFYSGDAAMVIIKAPDGEMGVLKGHMPMVVIVAAGPAKILADGKWLEAELADGFMEVKPDRAVILVDAAEWSAKS